MQSKTQEAMFEYKTVAVQVNSGLGCEMREDNIYSLIVFNAKSFIRSHSETATQSSPTCRIEILDETEHFVGQGQFKSIVSNQIQLYF